MITTAARQCLSRTAPRVGRIAIRSVATTTTPPPNGVDTDYTATSAFLEAKPDVIFDEIDVNQTGVITKEQFVEALDRLNYYELKRVHKAVHANMEQKLQTVHDIEAGLKELAAAHAEKHEAYSNVGMMTACEIDALFQKTSQQKKDITESVGQLKEMIAESKDATCPTKLHAINRSNVGMMLGAEIDALFPPPASEDEQTKTKM